MRRLGLQLYKIWRRAGRRKQTREAMGGRQASVCSRRALLPTLASGRIADLCEGGVPPVEEFEDGVEEGVDSDDHVLGGVHPGRPDQADQLVHQKG